MPLRPHECRQCISTWDIKEVTLTKGSRAHTFGADAGAFHLNLDWKACLVKMTCSKTGNVRQDAWRPGTSLMKPFMRDKIGLGVYTNTGQGEWSVSTKGINKYSPAPPLGEGRYVCCDARVGATVFSTTECCKAKKEIICECYARQAAGASPPFSVASCCVAGSEKDILRYGVTTRRNDRGEEVLHEYRGQGTDPVGVRTEIEQYLAWSLAKFAKRGSPASGSCTGTSGFLEWADGDEPEPPPIHTDWVDKCRCVMPTGSYDSLRCP